jgi:hypothetical protein
MNKLSNIIILILLIILCDRCRGIIDDDYYQTEQHSHYETNQRLDKNICKWCYRLLPSYLQTHYIKEEIKNDQTKTNR